MKKEAEEEEETSNISKFIWNPTTGISVDFRAELWKKWLQTELGSSKDASL